MAGYQEEQYWKEKRLYLQADEKEREIRDAYSCRIRRANDMAPKWVTEDQKKRTRMHLEDQCRQEVEFARLTILEPILDCSKKERLKQLREQKEAEELRRKEAEERRRKEEEMQKQKEEEERKRREEEQQKREEEERRLATIRAQKAAEKERERKIEYERQRKLEEKRRAAEQKEKKRKTVGCFFGTIVLLVVLAFLFFVLFV